MKIERRAVLAAATRLLAANPRASTTEIAAAASISRASLHRLFPGRDALIEAIAILAVEQVADAIKAARLNDGGAVEAIKRLTDAIVPLVHQFAFLSSEAQIYESERVRKEDRSVDQTLLEFFQRAQMDGAVRADLPAAWLVHAYSGLLYGVGVAAHRGDIAPRDTSRLVLSTFLSGTASQPATTGTGERVRRDNKREPDDLGAKTADIDQPSGRPRHVLSTRSHAAEVRK